MPWVGDEVPNAREELSVIEIAVAAKRKADETFGRLDKAVETLPERDGDRVVLVPVEDRHRCGHLADVPIRMELILKQPPYGQERVIHGCDVRNGSIGGFEQ